MSTPAALAAILYRSFGLEPPAVPPTPAGPERFVTLTAAPLSRPALPLRLNRLLTGGAITPTTPTRRSFR